MCTCITVTASEGICLWNAVVNKAERGATDDYNSNILPMPHTA